MAIAITRTEFSADALRAAGAPSSAPSDPYVYHGARRYIVGIGRFHSPEGAPWVFGNASLKVWMMSRSSCSSSVIDISDRSTYSLAF